MARFSSCWRYIGSRRRFWRWVDADGATCQFNPFSFFPDQTTGANPGDDRSGTLRQGPGFKFTSAEFLQPPPHGVLAKTGETAFLYLPFDGYKGPDSYAIKICAIVQGHSGCSSLTYLVEVR
jgi:hypothetical protein